MSHQKRVLRPIRSDVAPPVTSPPVYRGDIDTRGAAQDLVPRSFWVNFWDTLFFIFAGVAALVVSFLCTYFFGFKQADFDKERTVKKVRLGNREPVAK
mgnify:CR=1 FL=1